MEHFRPPVTGLPQPVVARFRGEVQGDLERHVGAQQAAVLGRLSGAAAVPAGFKRPLAVQALTDPWAGLIALEHHGHHLAELAASGSERLPSLIAAMEAGMGRPADSFAPIPFPAGRTREEHAAFLLAVLEQAGHLREKALRRLSRDDRRFLFDHAAAIVEHFIPHVEGLDELTLPQAEADRRFCQLVAEQVDYAAMVAAAQVLASLADESWLRRLEEAFRGAGAPALPPPPGVTGEVLLFRETPYGLVVIGGRGPNTYDLDGRIALLIDLGGDDIYRGAIAAAGDVEHGMSVVIDLSGNDTYQASPLGLATGRLGVGLLIDRAGDDVYRLAQGSGGAGFAGLGILYDAAGNDRYVGARFTQGAAVGGLGLLLDLAGDDEYQSFGYAVGFGGPSGVGAVIDVAGDDRYQCGDKYPSNYNDVGRQPGDPRFQYECFGLGAGSGKRIYSNNPEQWSYSLAGGLGMLIDLDGNDRYRSANFSQGCGYFFGLGLKLDMNGDDEHAAARYGHAAGAHYGVGLFVDYRGDDRYTSTGPHYNGGAAWDLSVMLGIDAGQGDDVYDFRRSGGLGLADHRSWSLFIEEGGRDRYLVGDGVGGARGMGMASHDSMSGFFDLAGDDEYAIVPRSDPEGSAQRGNGRTLLDGAGGLFVDR
ncbi:MAG: hypothetical protein EPO02_09030 [Nitrospirae bacterium]|nr:MAG: hypothetical protein EPO02_09030 [Nitrospirota bacterium]